MTDHLAALLKPEFDRAMVAESWGGYWSLDEAAARLRAAGVGIEAEAAAANAEEIAAGAVLAERARLAGLVREMEQAGPDDDDQSNVYWDGWIAALVAVLALLEPLP